MRRSYDRMMVQWKECRCPWLNPNWQEAGHFPPLVLFGSDFWQLNFYQNFQTFLEVKIDINWVNPERTKQMEPILRAKVEIFFKSENLKKCF